MPSRFKKILAPLLLLLAPAAVSAQNRAVENINTFMGEINNAFFFVLDIIAGLQRHFIDAAWDIGKVVLAVAVFSAAINHAITGQGLKDNVVKIGKALFFFVLVMVAYPKIIGFATSYTFELAMGSVGRQVEAYYGEMLDRGRDMQRYKGSVSEDTYRYITGNTLEQTMRDPVSFGRFRNLRAERSSGSVKYELISPSSVIIIVFDLAENCMEYATNVKNESWNIAASFGNVLKGLLMSFAVIFTGIFALIEYVVTYLEFIFVSSVGMILLPFSLWEGSKFAAEGFIKSMLGFCLKLLFVNIAIFLLVYGYVMLFKFMNNLKGSTGFTGSAAEMVFILFVCLLFFVLIKQIPQIAGGLLSGAPSLSATGAISAVGGAVAAAAGTAAAVGGAAGLAAKAGVGLVGGGAKSLGAAAGAFKEAGGGAAGVAAGISAFAGSTAGSAVQFMKNTGHNLIHSLTGGAPGNGGGRFGNNPDSMLGSFNSPDAEGNSKTLGGFVKEQFAAGMGQGKDSVPKIIG